MTASRRGAWAVPRPFLKWVGGKGQLLPELLKRVELAKPIRRYHEPFVGGGALFFELFRTGQLGELKAYLSDTNCPLIETYQAVRDDVEAVIKRLLKHKERHSEAYYYEVRGAVPTTEIERAARIIYLNKTGYNGLYRENSKGEFNVPFGRYKNPMICDKDNLRAVSEALDSAVIEQRSFRTVVAKARANDFVYFDPPYHPLSTTSYFTSYDRKGFNEDAQRDLANVYALLDEKGAKVLLSNSMTPLIRDLYGKYTVERVLAARNVNSKAGGRGKIAEALVRNFQSGGFARLSRK